MSLFFSCLSLSLFPFFIRFFFFCLFCSKHLKRYATARIVILSSVYLVASLDWSAGRNFVSKYIYIYFFPAFRNKTFSRAKHFYYTHLSIYNIYIIYIIYIYFSLLSLVRCFAAFVSFSPRSLSHSFSGAYTRKKIVFVHPSQAREPRNDRGTTVFPLHVSRFFASLEQRGKRRKVAKVNKSESRLYHKVAASFTNGLRVVTPLFIPLFVLFIPFSYVFLGYRFVSFSRIFLNVERHRETICFARLVVSNFHATLIRTRERGTKGERLVPPRLDHTFSSPFSLAYSVTNRSRRSIWSTGHLATGNVITLFFFMIFFYFCLF